MVDVKIKNAANLETIDLDFRLTTQNHSVPHFFTFIFGFTEAVYNSASIPLRLELN